jgi:alpha/beta superfamily hydrolase
VTTTAVRHPLFAGGNGMIFRHYRETVDEVVALEPEPRGPGSRADATARDTVGAIEAAGFHVQRIDHVTVGTVWGVTNPHVIGTAT